MTAACGLLELAQNRTCGGHKNHVFYRGLHMRATINRTKFLASRQNRELQVRTRMLVPTKFLIPRLENIFSES